MTDAPIGIDAPDAPLGDDAGNCTCPSDDNPCTLDFCMGGTCRHQPLGDRFGCPGGLCIEGACCTGCIDNMGRCRRGQQRPVLRQRRPRLRRVQRSGRLHPGRLHERRVPDAAADRSHLPDRRVRERPVPVRRHGPALLRRQPVPRRSARTAPAAGAAPTASRAATAAPAATTAAPGLLCEGDKCGKCGGVGQPCCADGSCQTGNVCAGATRICQPCGGMGQPCCATGDACGTNLACLNGACGCGGQGQPCCGGSMCTSDNNACNGVETCTNACAAGSAPVTCTAAASATWWASAIPPAAAAANR